MSRYANNKDGTLSLIAGLGDTSPLANKTDLTAIILTGTTNTSGNVISAGTWFYLNGTPCIAKVDIASGATFTEGTNYEEKTIGSALSELNSKSDTLLIQPTSSGETIHVEQDWDILLCTVYIGTSSSIITTYIHIVDARAMTQLLAGTMEAVTITPISKNSFTIALPDSYTIIIKSLFGKKVTVQS